jgi:hypothetical protein
MRLIEVVDDGLGFLLRIGLIDGFEVGGGRCLILGADVERQRAALSTVVDQPLRGVEITLGDQPRIFEEVAPAARADGEIQSRCDFEDAATEGAQLSVILRRRCSSWAPASALRERGHRCRSRIARL